MLTLQVERLNIFPTSYFLSTQNNTINPWSSFLSLNSVKKFNHIPKYLESQLRQPQL